MIHVYHHKLQTWEFYPRVYYFLNRLTEFVPRFKSIFSSEKTSKLLKGADDLGKSLDELHNTFIYPPEVTVIDEQILPISDFVIADVSNDTTSKSGLEKSRIEIVICHAKIDELNKGALEKQTSRLKLASQRQLADRNTLLLFICRSEREFTKSEKDDFCDKLRVCLKTEADYRVLFCKSGDESIRKEISDTLERRIIGGFTNVQSFITEHVPISRSRIASVIPLEDKIEDIAYQSDDSVVNNTYVLREIGIGSKDYVEKVLKKSTLVLKCSVTKLLSESHNIPQWLVNKLLVANGFEAIVFDCVYKKNKEANSPPKLEHLKDLSDDLLPIVQDADKSIEEFTGSLQKLAFEINGYLKKSPGAKDQTHSSIPTLNQDVRREIRRQKHIYGMGTIYGDLEIHVEKTEYVESVRKAVYNILRQRNITFPFVVKVIKSKANVFTGMDYEDGDPISCERGRRCGTLGGFLDGDDANLYGLTCAHVVRPNGQEKSVYINETFEFAKSIPELTVILGHGEKPLIDLAALRVLENNIERCMKLLKDENGILRQAMLFDGSSFDLVESFVYKYGAKTHRTKGIICSENYSVFSDDESDEMEHYALLIDSHSENGPPFAERGDSGSMVCMPNIDDTKKIFAIGLLNAGGLITTGGRATAYCFSFLLKDGLRKLQTQAGLQLYFENQVH